MNRALVLSLALALACSPATGPGADGLEFHAALTRASDAPGGATSPPTVRTSRGRIEVLGLISTPDPCQDLRGELTRSGSRIRVTVTARSQNVFCIAVIGTFAYAAVVEGLAPGAYLLEVVHAYENTGWSSTTVLTRAVAVP